MTSSVQVRAASSERGKLGCGLDHLLEVVEEQEQLPFADVLGEAVLRAERLRDRLGDQSGVAERREPDPEDAGAELRDERSPPPRSPAASCPEPPGPVSVSRRAPVSDQRRDLRKLRRPPDEGARRSRQVRVRDRLERREATRRRAGEIDTARRSPSGGARRDRRSCPSRSHRVASERTTCPP